MKLYKVTETKVIFTLAESEKDAINMLRDDNYIYAVVKNTEVERTTMEEVQKMIHPNE